MQLGGITRIKAKSIPPTPGAEETSDEEMEHLRSMRTAMCPGCGRYYRSKMWVKLHLRRGKCSGKRLGIKKEPKEENNSKENNANNEEDVRVE